MRSTPNIIWNVTGQTLSYRVPQGRPTSATFQVFREFASDDGTAEFSGSATVDSVSTSVTSASGRSQVDPQKINLTSTGIVTTGRKYLLSEAGMQEWVEPIEVETGYIRVRHVLRNDYTTAATLVSATITAAVDSTFVADRAKINEVLDPNPGYRVRWAIVVSGTTYIAYSFFSVVRADIAHHVDLDDVNARAPGLHDSIPAEYANEQGRPLIDAAWASVQAKFGSMGIDVAALRDDQILDEMVVLKALCILANGGWRPGGYASLGEYIQETRTEYDRLCEQHFSNVLKHRLASSTGGEADKVFAAPMWAK